MGIPGLWDMIKSQRENFQEKLEVPISELKGKSLAIDVSGWIVELPINPAKDIPYLYIRNLFFRTLGLLDAGINLIAVFDGTAPELKRKTLIKRNKGGTGNLERQQLKDKSEKCAEVLKCLGIRCITSPGEAEALCALLEKKGEVDGCITSDSDYFCYGGKNVFKGLIKNKKTHNFVINTYSSVETEYTQDDFIVFALLIGNNLDERGTQGIGWIKCLELINHLKSKNHSVLERVLAWRGNKGLKKIQAKIDSKTTKVSHCKTCDHPGSVKSHESKGCRLCDTTSGCNNDNNSRCTCTWHKIKYRKQDHASELNVRRKALEDPDFPNMQVIKEFKNSDMEIPSSDESGCMNVKALIKCMKRFGFSEDNFIKHITKTVILQDLNNVGIDQMFSPLRIIKECRENFVDCYEVEWEKTDKNNWAKKDSDQLRVERELFRLKYPSIVKNFENKKKTPKKPTKKKRKTDDDDGSSSSSPPKMPKTTVKKKIEL